MSKRKLTPLPDLEYLQQCFDLDAQQGILTWKERPFAHFATKRAWNAWNAGHAGKRAGNMGPRGYRRISIGDMLYFEHRVIFFMVHRCDLPETIDHINGVQSDNRIANLRAATNAENVRHRVKLDCQNTSGYRGVSWIKEKKKWRAAIKKDGKVRHLGYFDDPKQAAKKAAFARLKLFGKFAGKASEINKILGI